LELTLPPPPIQARIKEAVVSLLPFLKKKETFADSGPNPAVEAFLKGYSIEVMPRTAEKIEDFRDLLPRGTRVYVAHIDGTPIEEMVATAKRVASEGYAVMPHFPARIIAGKAVLADWIARYQGEAGVDQALLLGGGVSTPAGDYDNSMQLMESGLFKDFKRLHIAGHPEGNRDIDPDGSDRNVMEALRWKQKFSETTDAQMALATQFCFESAPVIAWANALRDAGITIPIHIGVAGPAKLQTLIKFAIACGVGPSLRVLQKRAMDVTKLLLPYEPNQMVADLAAHKATHPEFNIEAVHFFPLGGIKTNAQWATDHGGASGVPASQA
jgi:methylenetetrahydrofolate reductase (NADPH)